MQYGKQERAAIGGRMKVARVSAGLSEEEVAVLLGVEPLAIQAWERGKAMPCLVQFRELLGAYGVMACQILFDRNPLELTREEAAEIAKAAHGLAPRLQAKISVLLALLAKGAEKVAAS